MKRGPNEGLTCGPASWQLQDLEHEKLLIKGNWRQSVVRSLLFERGNRCQGSETNSRSQTNYRPASYRQLGRLLLPESKSGQASIDASIQINANLWPEISFAKNLLSP